MAQQVTEYLNNCSPTTGEMGMLSNIPKELSQQGQWLNWKGGMKEIFGNSKSGALNFYCLGSQLR